MNELDTIKANNEASEKTIEIRYNKVDGNKSTMTVGASKIRPFSEIRAEGRALGLKGKDLTEYVNKNGQGSEETHNLLVKSLLTYGIQFRLDKVCADTTLRFSAGEPSKVKKVSKTAKLEAEIARLKALIPAE